LLDEFDDHGTVRQRLLLKQFVADMVADERFFIASDFVCDKYYSFIVRDAVFEHEVKRLAKTGLLDAFHSKSPFKHDLDNKKRRSRTEAVTPLGIYRIISFLQSERQKAFLPKNVLRSI